MLQHSKWGGLRHELRPAPVLQEPMRDSARLAWTGVTKVAHYYLSVNAMKKSMQVREEAPPYESKP